MIKNSPNNRHRDRRPVSQVVVVINSLQKKPLGRLVNIHEEGFLLIGDVPLVEEGVYQIILELSEPIESKDKLDIGAECLWIRDTGGGDQLWAGFQIIDISEEDKDIVQLLGQQI